MRHEVRLFMSAEWTEDAKDFITATKSQHPGEWTSRYPPLRQPTHDTTGGVAKVMGQTHIGAVINKP